MGRDSSTRLACFRQDSDSRCICPGCGGSQGQDWAERFVACENGLAGNFGGDSCHPEFWRLAATYVEGFGRRPRLATDSIVQSHSEAKETTLQKRRKEDETAGTEAIQTRSPRHV